MKFGSTALLLFAALIVGGCAMQPATHTPTLVATIRRDRTVDPAQEAAFERAAQSYRNAQAKPQLPEEAVKYKVQAEFAVQQKRFDDAVDLYDKALGIAPWWPAGHHNRGLILGELQDYQGGIRALQKYLKLEPDASNARAVQLKIYQWESLVPRTAK